MPEPADPRPPLVPLLLLGAVAQTSLTVPMFAMPFVAKEYGLSEAKVAFVSGVISLGAFGAFLLSRLADRRGRRLVMRLGLAALAPFSFITALAPSVAVYTVAQLLASAFRGSLNSVVSVSITEVSPEHGRARNHGRLGLVSAAASGIPLMLAAVLGDAPTGWRWMFAATGAFVFALPWLWRRTPETGRFEQIRADGAAHGRVRDLLAPAWRRRSVGLVVVGVLRGAGLSAVGSYAFYHAVANLNEPAWVASSVLGIGGGLGMLGNGLGAHLSERWGRRPTQVSGALLTIVAGIAYYWVPADRGAWTPLGLGFCFLLYVVAIQAFSVADRLVDTELFPTRLRGTYAGVRTMGDAAAATLQNFGLSAVIGATGSIPRAMLWMVPALVLPALVLFWWVTTESRGLSLDEAALEKYPTPTVKEAP